MYDHMKIRSLLAYRLTSSAGLRSYNPQSNKCEILGKPHIVAEFPFAKLKFLGAIKRDLRAFSSRHAGLRKAFAGLGATHL